MVLDTIKINYSCIGKYTIIPWMVMVCIPGCLQNSEPLETFTYKIPVNEPMDNGNPPFPLVNPSTNV